MSDDIEQALSTLGRVPSGIFILTARQQEGDEWQETGVLCSWIMQAGFEPPMISVAIKQGRYVADWLDAGATFAINVVSERGKTLLSHFGKGFEPGEPAFGGLAVERGADELPLLTEDILGHLVCRSKSHVDSGDHRIFLAEVVDGNLLDDEQPMIHVRNSGEHY